LLLELTLKGVVASGVSPVLFLQHSKIMVKPRSCASWLASSPDICHHG
jgi:hypothetical protein